MAYIQVVSAHHMFNMMHCNLIRTVLVSSHTLLYPVVTWHVCCHIKGSKCHQTKGGSYLVACATTQTLCSNAAFIQVVPVHHMFITLHCIFIHTVVCHLTPCCTLSLPGMFAIRSKDLSVTSRRVDPIWWHVAHPGHVGHMQLTPMWCQCQCIIF